MIIFRLLVFVCSLGVVILLLPAAALAHRSGCHNLHTCPSDTNSYVCGDLGYPCNGATKVEDILPSAIQVPLVVEKAFVEIFGRVPTVAESAYWKRRFRDDKDGIYKIRRTLAWHKANNSFGPAIVSVPASSSLVPYINAIFRSVYDGRDPTVSEHGYWLTRIKDKPTASALRSAMAWHKQQGLSH